MNIGGHAASFEWRSLHEVRSIIARVILGDARASDRLGSVTLHPHQMIAARRLEAILDREGGALLSDVVGLGKTYTALAIAASRGPLLVIAPAVLRTMWLDAFRRAGVPGDFVSFEALSRGRRATERHRLVIIDEAHHARNPATRRYDGVARACVRAEVLLLSATPLHNSRADVASLLALFLGSRAFELTDDEVARFVVRRTSAGDATAVPLVAIAPSRVIIRDETTLDAIIALSPAVPVRDGSSAQRLLTIGLARQWVSSTAALAAALRRRVALGEALAVALDAGRYPSAHELRAWTYADDTMQLAFPELLEAVDAPHRALASAVRAHVAGARALLDTLRSDVSDTARADYVREIVAAHPGEKIVAFTAYAETAKALYRALRGDGRVALLTERAGVVAGGPLARDDVLARFAPRASGAAAPRAAEEISVLVATDLLSEGVNLQDASVVVHLDLPWTAARIAQRTGRVARLGATRDVVTSYTIQPPPRANAWLRSQEILAHKSAAAMRIFGQQEAAAQGARSTVSTDSSASPASPASPVGSAERIREMLRVVVSDPWRIEPPEPTEPCVAAVRVCQDRARENTGALVAIHDGACATLLAVRADGTVATGATAVEPFVIAALAGSEAAPDDARAERVLDAVGRWSARRRAASAAGVAEHAMNAGTIPGAARASRARHAVLRHASSLGASTPFARRTALAELATRIRHAAMRAIPIALEREVRELSLGAMGPDDATRLAALIARLDDRTRPRDTSAAEPCVTAAILIVHAE